MIWGLPQSTAVPKSALRSMARTPRAIFCAATALPRPCNFAEQSVRMRIPKRRTVNRASEAIQCSERSSAPIFNRKIEDVKRTPARGRFLERKYPPRCPLYF